MATIWGDIPSWAFDSARVLMQSLKIADPLTYSHCCRVGELAKKFARDAALSEYEQRVVEFAGLFHDIGKMGISQEIILKPGKLDDHEYKVMQSHPELSEVIVKPLSHHSFFKDLLQNIRGHHERIDGRGYPDKRIGDEIPLLARILTVVDTYDAMSQDRAYRKGLPDEVIYDELKRCAGTQFDAHLVKIFLEAHPKWNRLEVDPETDLNLFKKVV